MESVPFTTDKHIAGKLSLCICLPIMIHHNFATELCITKGQEGYVYGWKSTIRSKNGYSGYSLCKVEQSTITCPI